MRISATVIVSISVMLVFSILPAYAGHAGSDPGLCAKGFEKISNDDAIKDLGFTSDQVSEADKNDNDHVCVKELKSGKILLKDDNAKGEVKDIKK